jgi:hypothetical protein
VMRRGRGPEALCVRAHRDRNRGKREEGSSKDGRQSLEKELWPALLPRAIDAA